MESSAQPITPSDELTDATHGAWTQYDKQGTPVTFEWHKTTDAKTFYDLWELLIPTYAEACYDIPLMSNFLLDGAGKIKDQYAEVIRVLPQEDRDAVDTKLKIEAKPRDERIAHLRQSELHKLEQNRAKLLEHSGDSSDQGTCFVVIAKNASNDILGFAIFKICPRGTENASTGSVYLAKLMIAPTAQGRGLARHLVFSILRKELAPKTNRIYLGTDIWNPHAQAVYKTLDFKEFKPRSSHPATICFEYVIQS
jgi:RimJ/RimL family protein N-acetyltransferase